MSPRVESIVVDAMHRNNVWSPRIWGSLRLARQLKKTELLGSFIRDFGFFRRISLSRRDSLAASAVIASSPEADVEFKRQP